VNIEVPLAVLYNTSGAAKDHIYLFDIFLKALLRTQTPARSDQGSEMLPTTTNMMAMRRWSVE
jgi:hypothetical protein